MMINLCVIGASRIPCMAPELLAGEDMGIPGLSPPRAGALRAHGAGDGVRAVHKVPFGFCWLLPRNLFCTRNDS